VIAAPVVWLVHRSHTLAQTTRAEVRVALTVHSVILLSPLGWPYHLPWLALPLKVCWLERQRLPHGAWWAPAYVAILAVAAWPTKIKAIPSPTNPPHL
jgi:hypothetical protein